MMPAAFRPPESRRRTRRVSDYALTHNGRRWTWGRVAAVYILEGGMSSAEAALHTGLSEHACARSAKEHGARFASRTR